MRVLLSTIGSRGEVQPVVALASELRALGQEVRVCVPPDFREWIEGLGIPVVPIGPEVRPTAQPAAPWTPEQRLRMIEGTVATQFATITPAAADCDVIVGAGALQVAARSIAEQRGIPYAHAHYCPVTLPSPHHPPLQFWGAAGDDGADNRTLWADDARRWTDSWGPALNDHRAAAGLAPVADVRAHLLTDRPLLAADPTLGPWPGSPDLDVEQPGAWIWADPRPLAPELEAFLDAGGPPVYFGFGSMPAAPDVGRAMITAARELGRRAIVARGWAGVTTGDDGPDRLSVGEVNQQVLFPRVAAAVHHGGAGTTAAAAAAGVPQVLVPQKYDQTYWSQRAEALGIGTASGTPTAGSLTAALDRVLRPDVAARAAAVAAQVRTDGARGTAEQVSRLGVSAAR